MGERVNDQCIDVLLRKARTQNGYLPKPVTDEELREVYDLMKLGPTSANCSPSRFIFVRTPEGKARTAEGTMKLVGAVYELEVGRVRFLR